jgi:hypothetical protein
VARWHSVITSAGLDPLVLRSPTEDDWDQMALLHGVSFGTLNHRDSFGMFRSLVADDGAVVVCDNDAVVGMAVYFDMQLTVTGVRCCQWPD